VALNEPGSFAAMVLTGSGSSRVFSTQDAGRTWSVGADDPLLRRVVADPLSADTLWALTDTTVKKSADRGMTFQASSPPAVGRFFGLVAFRRADRTALLALDVAGQMSRSLDSGATWDLLPGQDFLALAADQERIYGVDSADRLWRSTDFGSTWTEIGRANRWLAAGGGLLAFVDPVAETLNISSDGGSSFVASSVNEDLDDFENRVWIDGNGAIYLEAIDTLYRSRDRGRTWQSLAFGYPAAPESSRDPIVAAVAADAGDPDRVMMATGAGLWLGRFGDGVPVPLAGGRFAARLSWRDPQGLTGAGVATHLTADTGLFWLFTPERSEVAVKLLDARHLNGRFWLFLGSLSNVELDLEILDRATNEVYRYHNPQRQFLSFGDTSAFPRSDATPAGAALASGTTSGLFGGVPVLTLADRFEVSIAWRTATGTGEALGRQLSTETAAFRFFSDSNVELLVNVIDGRPINGKYWVFSASLSDVEYEITVKDRMSGAVKTYRNPAGTFASTADVSAF
jgi:photosystem II stability/assembly factor-like uncharacterized protein